MLSYITKKLNENSPLEGWLLQMKDLPRYQAFLKNEHPLCGKAQHHLDGYPCDIHSLPLSSLQLSKFPSSFGDQYQILCTCTLKAPNPARSSTTLSLDNNNYQKNYYIRVMCEDSNYLRISLL
jgi:hypothetical protein